MAYFFLRNPFVSEAFTVDYSEEATKKLNLNSGDYVLVWLSTMSSWLSGRYAMGWVIKFYVVDPNGQEILREFGIAGTGILYPKTFVAEQSGVYVMHFENSIGDRIDKEVHLSYKVTRSFFGVPVEALLFLLAIAFSMVTAIVALIMAMEKPKTTGNPFVT